MAVRALSWLEVLWTRRRSQAVVDFLTWLGRGGHRGDGRRQRHRCSHSAASWGCGSSRRARGTQDRTARAERACRAGCGWRSPLCGRRLVTALNYLTQSLAGELAGSGVRVNVVAPGPIDTPIHQTWADDLEEAYRWLATQVPLRRIGEAARSSSPSSPCGADGAACSRSGGSPLGHSVFTDRSAIVHRSFIYSCPGNC